MMKLTLSTPMAYRPSELSLDEMTEKAAHASPGYDAMVLYELSLSDSLSVRRLEGGERDAFTEEERLAVQRGVAVPAKDDETFIVPAGGYSFLQLPAVFTEKDLPRLLLPFSAKCTRAYVRIFHENVLETVMQLFLL